MYDDIDPRNLPIGTVVDGYTLTGKLGGGGMGEIYRVQRGREVFALKLQGERLTAALDPVKREELEARSRREAAVLLSLSHPNILAIIGSGRWPDRGGYLYLITELVAGEPLDSWHQRKQPSLRGLARVFERVADALDYMHRAGIYHRDLKDPNVLVREDGTPVVIDLGIARSAAAYTLTRVGAVIGTTTHLSPGVCRYLVGEKSHAYRFGAHDDLHALGFMLYERLTGTAPFRQRSDVEWPEFDYYRQVMDHVPSAPQVLCPTVPEVLSSLTMRLLAKTPEASYRDARELHEELENALVAAPSSWDLPYPVPRDVQRRDLTRSGPVRLPQPDDVDAKKAVKRPPPLPLAALSLESQPVEASLPHTNTERAIAALRSHPSGQAREAGSPEFRPPTQEAPVGFISPEEPAPQAPTPHSNPLSDTTLREAAEQVRPETRPARRVGTLALVLLGTAVLVVAGVVVKSVAERSRPQPKSLLQRYQEELAAEPQRSEQATGGGEVPAVPGWPTHSVAGPGKPTNVAEASAASPAAENAPALASPHAQSGQRSAPSASDAKAIQAELERTYGTRRPSIPGKAAVASPGMPSWVKGVEVVDAKPAVGGERKLGGRYGDHLRLQLRSNLDSRLCGSGTVEAVLVRPYLVNGEVVLPVRTLAYGQCAAQGQRFLVTLHRLRLPDGTDVHFEAVALDVADGKPGLLASRRLGSGSAPREGVGGTVARGAASTMLSTATAGGSLGEQLASGAGQTALNASGPEASSAGGEEAILLDAGGDMDVFLRQGF
jgi:serine/threonine protein kinase